MQMQQEYSNPHDSRIMLRILLSEARRYHDAGADPKEWACLKKQVEEAWDGWDCSPEDKYMRLKCRLTSLFLWDRCNPLQRDLQTPPTTALEKFHSRQRDRLENLPVGSLFHHPNEMDTGSSSSEGEHSETDSGSEDNHHAATPRMSYRDIVASRTVRSKCS